MHAACLEATYEHWKADMDKRDADWEREEVGPEGYKENKGYVFDFFIPVTDCHQWYSVMDRLRT